ncbi:hypothetical protein J1605_018757 [Eschrichtius robustus]|uniref:Uncharacterized protein n=1 Tax=Eschrichtius robustus TaxID=9764 RepID=A0AB34HRR9_ESCRO|nr:hypothetical protein J1605_018757 [Eschrichtius robustus]
MPNFHDQLTKVPRLSISTGPSASETETSEDLSLSRSLQSTEKSSLCYTESNQELYIKLEGWASLVAQWLRICLPVQGTRVRALVWEDPTCHGATRPVSHNY